MYAGASVCFVQARSHVSFPDSYHVRILSLLHVSCRCVECANGKHVAGVGSPGADSRCNVTSHVADVPGGHYPRR
jgi:hypothetical protein